MNYLILEVEIKSTIIVNSENFEAAKRISQQFENVKEEIAKTFWTAVGQKVIDDLGSDKWTLDMRKGGEFFVFAKECDVVGYYLKGTDSNNQSIHIHLNYHPKTSEKTNHFKDYLLQESKNHGYNKADLSIDQMLIGTNPFFEKENLSLILPLNSESFKSEVNKKVEQISLFVKKHIEYIKAIRSYSQGLLQNLENIKNSVENYTQAFSNIFIWQDYVLGTEVKMADASVLVFDTKLKDGKWQIETFFRGWLSKSLSKKVFFKNIDFITDDITFSKDRIILKVFTEDTATEDIAKVLSDLVESVTNPEVNIVVGEEQL
ncbi:MAG TPA: hypothetical protein VEV44_17495 [Pseudoneobacillus sp.]|nr:hypothetical protein [Pseudoneobacillus sp.]